MRKSVYTREGAILADVIATARKAAGLNQEELASRLGRDQSIISNIERGQRRVDVIEFYEICRALDCDPRRIFGELTDQWEDISN